jgi:hypothetical protein
LAPPAERHSHFFLEKSFDRSFSGTRSLTDLRERLAVAWVSNERFRDSERPPVGQVRQLQGNHLNCLELIDDHVYQVTLRLNTLRQSSEVACLENQLFEQP